MSQKCKAKLDSNDLAKVVGGTSLSGTAGNDIITGSADHDMIAGGDGNDIIDGGDGRDYITGGAGDDSLIGGYWLAEDDTLIGGAGNDVFIWNSAYGNDEIQGGDGVDTVRVLSAITMNGLLAALSVDGAMFLVRHVSDNRITFTDRDGNPASFSGTLSINGATLRFSGIEAITLE